MARRVRNGAAIVMGAAMAVAVFAGAGQTREKNEAGRPAITGVSNIGVYTSNAAAAQHFYVNMLGLTRGDDPENPSGVRYYVSAIQFVEVLPLPAGAGAKRLDHLGYETADAERMRGYLEKNGFIVPERVERGPEGSRWFYTKDPEGNPVEFVQAPKEGWRITLTGDAVSRHIIHVGMRVHDRAAEDRFYRGVLGFRPYWFGGMHAGEVDWVSQQVPDGTDWLEYMLQATDGSQRNLGVLNHFSLGVANMKKTVAKLTAENRLSPQHNGPLMGRDGKWQANLFDPDGTRVELMEFAPVEQPCCSPFTAANPTH